MAGLTDPPSPAQRIISLYEEHAGAWDELRGRILKERDFIDAFLAEVRPGGSILDLGCGGGESVGRYLIERGFAVTGLDSAPSLIAMCRERFADQEWLVGDMRALDLPSRFGGILAWYSMFHLTMDDQRALIPRLAAHAGPNAALCFTSGPQHGEAIGEWQGEPLYHGSLSQTEYRALLEQSGFEVLSFRAGMPVADGPSVWLARFCGNG